MNYSDVVTVFQFAYDSDHIVGQLWLDELAMLAEWDRAIEAMGDKEVV